MTVERESNFESDWHTLYVGWVIGIAAKNGLPVKPVVDEDGNYLPEIQMSLDGGMITVILAVPPPPDGWELE